MLPQVTILDNEARSTSLINHLNTTAVASAEVSAGEIANVSIVSRSYFGNTVPADSGDLFVIQIREKVRARTTYPPDRRAACAFLTNAFVFSCCYLLMP